MVTPPSASMRGNIERVCDLPISGILVMPWDPDPYSPHPPDGPYHQHAFAEVVEGVHDLLRRYDSGTVERDHLLRGKDNGPRKRDTLNYWLFWQHHPQHERWKCLGQRYWSIAAWGAWREYFQSLPLKERFGRDGFPALRSLPKPATLPVGRNGSALVSEHVVPKKVMQSFLLPVRSRDDIAQVLRANLCCVVTRSENARLPPSWHPDQDKPIKDLRPWNRYRGRGITVLEHAGWTFDEREALSEAGLLVNGHSPASLAGRR